MSTGFHPPQLINPAWYGQNWKCNHGTIVTPNSAPIILRPADPRRVSLLATSANGVWFRFGINDDINGLEYLLTAGGSSSAFFSLRLADDGGIVQQQIYIASHTGTAIRVSWVESLWLPIGSA